MLYIFLPAAEPLGESHTKQILRNSFHSLTNFATASPGAPAKNARPSIFLITSGRIKKSQVAECGL